MRILLTGLFALLAACGSSGGSAIDAAVISDGAVLPDATSGADGRATDGAPLDATTASDGASIDAAPNDGGACHVYSFGSPAVTLRHVTTLAAATGGVIPLGSYDAVDAQTTGSTTGTFRSTWVFESATVLQVLDQLTLTATPPTPVPRAFTYVANPTTFHLARTASCGGTTDFDNEYSVRVVGADTFVDVKQSTILFSYKKR